MPAEYVCACGSHCAGVAIRSRQAGSNPPALRAAGQLDPSQRQRLGSALGHSGERQTLLDPPVGQRGRRVGPCAAKSRATTGIPRPFIGDATTGWRAAASGVGTAPHRSRPRPARRSRGSVGNARLQGLPAPASRSAWHCGSTRSRNRIGQRRRTHRSCVRSRTARRDGERLATPSVHGAAPCAKGESDSIASGASPQSPVREMGLLSSPRRTGESHWGAQRDHGVHGGSATPERRSGR